MNTNRETKVEKILENFHLIRRKLANKGNTFHKTCKMTFTQTSLLFFIKSHKNTTITQISKILGVTKSAATQMINALATQDLLLLTPHKTDKRIMNINISKKGLKVVNDLKIQFTQEMFDIFRILDDEEINQLENITHKLITYKK